MEQAWVWVLKHTAQWFSWEYRRPGINTLIFLEGKCRTNKEDQIISPATETPLAFYFYWAVNTPLTWLPHMGLSFLSAPPISVLLTWQAASHTMYCISSSVNASFKPTAVSHTPEQISICSGSLANNLFSERCHSTHSKSVCFFKLSSCCSEIDYEFPWPHWAMTPDAPAHLCLGQVAAVSAAGHELVSRATVMQKATLDTQEGARAVERTIEYIVSSKQGKET